MVENFKLGGLLGVQALGFIRLCVDMELEYQTVTATITEMSKKGKEGGMDKEKELGKLYKELASLRCLYFHIHFLRDLHLHLHLPIRHLHHHLHHLHLHLHLQTFG